MIDVYNVNRTALMRVLNGWNWTMRREHSEKFNQHTLTHHVKRTIRLILGTFPNEKNIPSKSPVSATIVVNAFNWSNADPVLVFFICGSLIVVVVVQNKNRNNKKKNFNK